MWILWYSECKKGHFERGGVMDERVLKHLCAITEEEQAKYLDKYAIPEEISQEEVEGDIGFTIVSW